MVDSNHRRRCQQIYSLSPLATREISHIIKPTILSRLVFGAGGRTWTPDLLITNQLLYQLSYTSLCSFLSNLSSKLLTLHYYTTIIICCQEKIENILIFVCLWEKFVQLCLWVKINQFCKLVFNSVFAYIDRLFNKLKKASYGLAKLKLKN